MIQPWIIRGRAVGRLVGFGVIAILLAAIQGGALAADSPASKPGDRMVADQLATLAWQALTGAGEPDPAQLKAGSLLLDLALQTDAAQADLWLWKRELAQRSDKNELDLTALRNYIRLRPSDDVAQLELFYLSVVGQQTVQDRIQAIENGLDSPKAAGLSAALRSRLASYVAQGAREIGDQARLGKRLKQALELDTSNHAAAQMLLELVKEKPNASPVERALAWLTMVQAQPVDPAARLELAAVLLDAGLTDLASQQFAVAQVLSQGSMLEPSVYHDWAVSLISQEQYDAAAGLLDSLEQRLAQEATLAAAKAAKEKEHGATSSEPCEPSATTPSDSVAELPIDLQVLRLVALGLSSREQSQTRQAAITKLDQAFRKQPDSQLDWLGIQMVLGPKADWQLPEDLDKSAVGKRILGWYHLQNNQPEKAMQWLTPLATSDALAAYGLTKLAPAGQQQINLLRPIAAGPVRSLATMLAKADLARRQARYIPSDAVSASLGQLCKSKPVSLMQPADSLSGWLRWNIKAPQSVGYLQPLVMQIQVTNHGPVALAIDASGPVFPQALLAIETRLAGHLVQGIAPMLVGINQALSLQPGQTLEIPIRVDRRQIGMVLANAPGLRATLSGRMMLGALPDSATGQMIPNPLTGTILLPVMGREPAVAATTEVENVIEQLSGQDELARFQAAGYLMTMLPTLWAGPRKDELRPLLTQSLTQAFEAGGSTMACWLAMGLKPSVKGDVLLQSIHDQAAGSSDDRLRILYIASQIMDVESPVLVQTIQQKRAPVSDFAKAWQRTIWLVQQAQKAQAQAMEEAKAKAADDMRSGKPKR